MMFKKVRLDEAVGLPLAHDITEIRPGEFKGAAFKRGHLVSCSDLCHLQKLGKRHLYILDLAEDEVHEDEAAAALAKVMAGPGVVFDQHPKEGKVGLRAAHQGLLKVRAQTLFAFNLPGDMMAATRHTHSPVEVGQQVAATRIIPLVIKRARLDEALELLTGDAPLVQVLPYNRKRAGLLITGSEVISGLIQDEFQPIMERKFAALDVELVQVFFAGDDAAEQAQKLRRLRSLGADLIVTTGGMSVDPDDVTRLAVFSVGAEDVLYSTAVLPGAMFMVARWGESTILGVPACALHHEVTVFDLILPRVMAGEIITRPDLAAMGHGGLCLDCEQCHYPQCSFGKSGYLDI